MTGEWRETGEFSPHATRLAEILRGINLLAADKILDDARRFAWLKTFTGFKTDAIQQAFPTSDIAFKIAVTFAGLNLAVIDDLLGQTRTLLWTGHFLLMPNTRYGREVALRDNQDDVPMDPAKMN